MTLMSLLSPLYCLDPGTLTTRIYGVDSNTLHRIPTTESKAAGKRNFQDPLINRGRVTDQRRLGRYLQSSLPRQGRSLWGIAKPRIVACVPAFQTQVEKIALAESLGLAGAGAIRLVSTAVAAAAGSGVDLNGDRATLLLSCGHASSELSVIVSGDQIFSLELRLCMQELVDFLKKRLEKEKKLQVKSETISKIIATNPPLSTPKELEFSAKDISSGKFLTARLSAEDYSNYAQEFLQIQVKEIEKAINSLPSALAADIIEQGIIMYGGFSNMKGLNLFLSSALSIPVSSILEPEECVIKGLKEIASSISFDEINDDYMHIEVLGCN